MPASTPRQMVCLTASAFNSRGNFGEAKKAPRTALVLHSGSAGGPVPDQEVRAHVIDDEVFLLEALDDQSHERLGGARVHEAQVDSAERVRLVEEEDVPVGAPEGRPQGPALRELVVGSRWECCSTLSANERHRAIRLGRVDAPQGVQEPGGRQDSGSGASPSRIDPIGRGHRTPSASGGGASERLASRAYTPNSAPVVPGPMTTTKWRR